MEADEVDLGRLIEDGSVSPPIPKRTQQNTRKRLKRRVQKAARPKVREQWGGTEERGYQDSLVLFRFTPIETEPRAHGPGPIGKRDWESLGEKYLAGKNVILRNDGAPTYELEMDGVIQGSLVHKRRQMRSTWAA